MGELLSCPFCGEEAETEEIRGGAKPCYGVGCPSCDFQIMSGPVGIGWFASEHDATEYWNRRAEPVATPPPAIPAGYWLAPVEPDRMRAAWAAMRAAAPKVDAQPQRNTDLRGGFVVYGYGESEHPEVHHCATLENAAAILEEMTGPAEDGKPMGWLDTLRDDDEWGDGIHETRFEIGGIVVLRLAP